MYDTIHSSLSADDAPRSSKHSTHTPKINKTSTPQGRDTKSGSGAPPRGPMTASEIIVRALLFAIAGSISFAIMLSGVRIWLTDGWPDMNSWVRDLWLSISVGCGQTILFAITKRLEQSIIGVIEHGPRSDKEPWWNSAWYNIVWIVYGITLLGVGETVFLATYTYEGKGADIPYLFGSQIVSFGLWSAAADATDRYIGKPLINVSPNDKSMLEFVFLSVLKVPLVFIIVVLGKAFVEMAGPPAAAVRPLFSFSASAAYVIMLLNVIPSLYGFLAGCKKLLFAERERS